MSIVFLYFHNEKNSALVDLKIYLIKYLCHFFICLSFSSWCLQAVMNRIHTISVPYAVMKACPLSWVQRVHVQKGI